MSEINFAALDKFRAAANYAQAIDNNPTGGGSVVIHLHDGEKLKCDYSRTDTPRSLSHFMFLRSGDEKRLNNETRALFKQTVIGIFGKSIDDVPKSVRDAMNLDKFDNSGKPLTARRIIAVSTAIQDALKPKLEATAQRFGITGGAAGEILSSIGVDGSLTNAVDPAGAFKERTNRHATASITTHIASRAKDKFDYKNFTADFNRGMGLTLGGTKLTTKSPAEAVDKVVQFLTGRDDATMDNVDETTRRKAAILMSILNQGALACIMTGVNNGFDPTAKQSQLGVNVMTAYGGNQEDFFSVSKDKDGNLSITGQVVFTGGLLLQFVNGDNISNKVTGNDGSFATYSGKISLSAADLDKLANADWEKLDMGPISEVDLNRNIDDRFKKAADMIPDDFKFTGSVDVTFNLHTDSLLDMSAIGA